PVTVKYATSDGTGKAGTNYTTTAGTLSFAAGQTSTTLTVALLDDKVVPNSNAERQTLSAPTGGATLGIQPTSTLTATEADHAGALQFSSAASNVAENAGKATITVTRTGGSDGPVTVKYATSDGTGKAGTNYTATSGTLSFAAGQTSMTLDVPVLDDK